MGVASKSLGPVLALDCDDGLVTSIAPRNLANFGGKLVHSPTNALIPFWSSTMLFVVAGYAC